MMTHKKAAYSETPVKITSQVETGEHPGHFTPYPQATVLQDPTPNFDTTWDLHNQPRHGPSSIRWEAAATYVMMQIGGIAAAVRYVLRRAQAHDQEFAALKAVALHPAHQIL